MACLCAPTSHEGSFRCRLHRGLNPSPNPAQSIANQQLKGSNYCTSTINAISNQICCNPPHITVRESSASASASAPASTAPAHPFYDHFRFSHTPQAAAANHQSSMHMRPPSTSPSPCLSSSSYRSSSSSLCTSSSSSSSRSSSSSSSPSPSSLPVYCIRPPPGKRTSSPSKPPYHVSSSSSANGTMSPSASHAAALAIMKQHSHNKHGARTHNRNTLGPTSASKIGPSRLSRMAVACADDLPLLKEEQPISTSPRHGSAPDTFSGSFAETAASREFASFKTDPLIRFNTRSAAVNKFKQSESSCRVVGSKEGSLIMPIVY